MGSLYRADSQPKEAADLKNAVLLVIQTDVAMAIVIIAEIDGKMPIAIVATDSLNELRLCQRAVKQARRV